MESCCSYLFDKFFPPIDKAIAIAGYSKEELDDIILVGGSSRIPIITTRLETYFGKPVNKQLSPDEAICKGATYYAGLLQGDPTLQDVSFKDIAPMTIGTDYEDDSGITKVFPIIPKAT